jgi:serine/threonine protein kinase
LNIIRDLKPENIVLDSNGFIKLTDFGLSKEGVYDNTSAKSFCGSLAYLAPEVLKRQGHGKSVDWYLFGVLMYEMLVGIPPFYTSVSKEVLFYNIQKGKLNFPEDISPDAKSLIIKLLNRNPNKRLGSGHLDANEIKSQSFFNGIDFNHILDKKFDPPKFPSSYKKLSEIKLKNNTKHNIVFNREVIEDMKNNIQCKGNQIEGWTFIDPNSQN